jgi:Na+-transporting methylmalonyl-CoA/oxaloacetate decarboxylase gamma subunit|tara:strand:- start:247 stop:480 length:234 start_codon:yes stop_codon:yes gene_type:complete
MKTESTLIESGISLLLTGMIVVFFFLLTLIISIYLLQLFFSESSNNRSPLASNPNTDGPIDKIHERIINEVMERRQT